jgi:hypothetical protein
MHMHMRDFVAALRRDVRRWHEEATHADLAGCVPIAAQIRRWIAEASEIINSSGY